jgi:Flp pilus assembly protein TadD
LSAGLAAAHDRAASVTMGFVRFFRRSLARWSAQDDARPEPEPKPAAAAGDDAKTWYRRGKEHLAAGRPAEAGAALARAIELKHDYAEALVLQALAYKRQGRTEDATDSLVLAEHFRPDLAEVQFQLGLLAGASREAEDRFRKASEADPGHFMALNALGALLFKRRVLEEAGECFRRAIAIQPGYALAHSNLGCLLLTYLDEFPEGAKHIEIAWQLNPSDATVMCNWAGLVQQRGKLAEALELWTRLVDKGGEDVELARLNRALVLLKQGEFARGWADYEARKRTESEYHPRGFSYPEWQDEPLAGRTILVHAEQGLGDQIMFASCIPDLIGRAGHCVVECAPKLEAIFRRSFPAATVVGADKSAAGDGLAQAPAIDYQVALGSLPLRFRNSFGDFPAHDGYLCADAGKTAAWRRRLEALPGRRRIGISWRGGMRRTRQAMRSLPLAAWLPILQCAETAFVSLQYTDCAAELSEVERDHGIRICHWQEAIDDYDQTAALVCALDLVISVQTSIVHLSGALGRRAWVMVPAVAEWRYLESGERMPWYPAVRIWRQDCPDEWQPLVERVAAALQALEPRR